MVLLDRDSGRYFELNATGAAIVRSLTEGTDPVQELRGGGTGDPRRRLVPGGPAGT
ncbi:PqqD family peptide modification chaperone [Saccharothrix longispora]|uniref:PqqD family peptide modification chaperone n=1 Tax=Saccharothrix longispora TaxID=33920 RepID=UPI003376266C